MMMGEQRDWWKSGKFAAEMQRRARPKWIDGGLEMTQGKVDHGESEIE